MRKSQINIKSFSFPSLESNSLTLSISYFHTRGLIPLLQRKTHILHSIAFKCSDFLCLLVYFLFHSTNIYEAVLKCQILENKCLRKLQGLATYGGDELVDRNCTICAEDGNRRTLGPQEPPTSRRQYSTCLTAWALKSEAQDLNLHCLHPHMSLEELYRLRGGIVFSSFVK